MKVVYLHLRVYIKQSLEINFGDGGLFVIVKIQGIDQKIIDKYT